MNAKNKALIWGIVGLVIIGLILFFALKGTSEEKTVKIGVIGTLTGVGSYHGQQETKGLEMAKDEINSDGGINGKLIELVYEDSGSDAKKAVSALQKLINVDEVKWVIGDSWVTTTAAMVPLANEKQVIMISPIAQLDSLSQDDYFFRTIPNTRDMIKPLAKYAYHNMSARKVGIIKTDTPFGFEHAKDFKEEFEALGGKIVGDETIGLTQSDVRTELSKINEKNPDTIFDLHASGASIGLLIKQAKELGINVSYLASFGAENDPLLKQYGEVSEGLVYAYPYDLNSEDQGIRDFVEGYKQRYSELPDLTAADSYDALKVLSYAINKAGEDTKKIKAELLSIQDYYGGSGTLSFDSNGDVKKPIIIKSIRNKSFVRIA